jgi:hypothetical protein
MVTAFRTHTILSLEQAVDSSPSLAALQQRIRDSQRYLDWIQPVLPAGLRQHVTAGPVQDTDWCLLVNNTSVSTKLRHLLPALLSTLRQHGAQINSIRVKVRTSER